MASPVLDDFRPASAHTTDSEVGESHDEQQGCNRGLGYNRDRGLRQRTRSGRVVGNWIITKTQKHWIAGITQSNTGRSG